MANPNDLKKNLELAQHPKAAKASETLRDIGLEPSHAASDQVPVDIVEEESMESFPASDPPGHFRSHASGDLEPHRPTDDEV